MIPLLSARALADPCGMVPPRTLAAGTTLARDGTQRTSVMHRRGTPVLSVSTGCFGVG